MMHWTRRIRAAIGMGLTWAFAWGVGGSLLARLAGVNTDLPLAFLFTPLGFISGVVFSGVLVAVAGRGRVNRFSLSRFAAWGAASGLLLSGVIVVGAALRGGPVLSELLLFGPPLTIAGALCAAGSLALARRAERRELVGGGAELADAELAQSEGQELLGRGK